MPKFRSILPGNATQLERDLERAGDLGKFSEPLDLLRRAKLDAVDSYVPFLIWEYGLGELLPYLKDPRRALSEGILWQRLRGTPKALLIALDWIDFDTVIEQEETGMYFSEFQLDPGKVIRDASVLPNVIAISRLSAPARSRLSRIYHGYDVRRLKLSEGPKGQLNHHLLSDYSGVRGLPGLSRLCVSFGETFNEQVVLADPDILPRFFADHTDYRRVYTLDTYRTSVNLLSEGRHLANPFFYHSHLFSFGNDVALPVDQEDLEERKFQKAQIALSDGWESGGLSDHNGVVAPHWVDVYEGDDLTLSEGVELSNNIAEFVRVTTLLRTYEVHSSEALLNVGVEAFLRADHLISETATRKNNGLSDGLILPFIPKIDAPVALTYSRIGYGVERVRLWDGLWSEGDWSTYDLADHGAVSHTQSRIECRKFAKAQIVLSDDGKLSTLNGVTPGFHKKIIDGVAQVMPTFERLWVVHPGAAVYDSADLLQIPMLRFRASTTSVTERQSKVVLSEMPNKGWLSPIDIPIFGAIKTSGIAAEFYRIKRITGEEQYADQHWIGILWPEKHIWDGINVVASMTHTTENKGQ